MTATDELRRLLDERGVKYYKHEDGEPLRELHEGRDDATSWRVGGANVCAVPFDDYTFDLWIDHATPEQAIAATLGSHERTTKMCRDEHGIWHCAACERGADVITGNDGELDSWHDSWAPNYCPYCGAKVVEQ